LLVVEAVLAAAVVSLPVLLLPFYAWYHPDLFLMHA